jgi:CheY-like chemotaxis protein
MIVKKVLIVEDDLLIAGGMKVVLTAAGFLVTAIAPSSEKALEAIRAELPDVVLMDIELSGHIDGISTARTVRRDFPSVLVIFITRRQDIDTFKNAKESFPENYLIKPFTDIALISAVELAIQNGSRTATIAAGDAVIVTDGIFIPINGFKVKLLFKDILYIRAGGMYSQANGGGSYSSIFYECTKKDETLAGKAASELHYEVAMSANQLVKQIPYPQIVQVHRSYHVNVEKVDRYKSDMLYIGKSEIPIGANYYTESLKKMFRSLQFDAKKK